MKKDVKIRSGKNNLSATIFSPASPNQKLAILLPGFLDSKDYPHLVKLGEELSEKGYTVVSFNPTGTWDSEGDISEYSMKQYLIDISEVINYMKSQGSFSKIFLAGHSFGAQVPIVYAATHPEISGIASIMPGRNIGITYPKEVIDEWKKEGQRESKRDLPNKPDEYISFTVPFSFIEQRLTYHSEEYAKKLTTPALYIAGEFDELHPVYDVKEIYDVTPDPKKFIILKNEGHDYRKNDASIQKVNSYVLDLFEKL